MSVEDLKKMFLSLEAVIIGVGFFMALPQSLPTDPRYRIRTPKMNPSRTYTPAGTVGWGGMHSAYIPSTVRGYMPAGMTLPGLDIFGSKPGFSEQQPWIFNDMDTISFYEVSEEEYDGILAELKAGEYEFDVKEGVFDMAAHNDLLAQTSEEAAELQTKRSISQAKMVEQEKQLLEKWLDQKQSTTTSTGEIQTLLEDPTIDAIEAPVNANVWKVLAKEGDILQTGTVVSILEAMKMEINVVTDGHLAEGTVVKVLIKPGDAIESGKSVVLVKASSRL
ncbi:hypothetical protein BDW69DRAFT_159960 [Aspergillus filifer]